jgi:hypothetical protein
MTPDSLTAPMKGAEHREIGGVQLDVARAGDCRVKRMIYPPGFRWSRDMKAIVGTELCHHAHVGFLAHGQIHIQYADGVGRPDAFDVPRGLLQSVQSHELRQPGASYEQRQLRLNHWNSWRATATAVGTTAGARWAEADPAYTTF